MLSSLLPLLPLLPLSLALDASSIRSRSVYQVVTDRFALPSSSSSSTTCDPSARTYCGGTWAGITSKLSYIQGMGFDTVWISPVVSNIGGTTGEGEAYHGYWTLDPSQLNSKFGTADDLKSLVSTAHAMGMYIMVDVVINHVAATSSSTFSPSSAYGPFAAADDYHPFCWITDYTNQTNVEDCWLGDDSVALPDLNTESSTVASYWNSWVTQLVGNYSFDAVRIDTVKHVPQTFWPAFTSAAGVFNQGEVLHDDPTYVAGYQKNADVNPFNYPAYYPLVRAFNGTGGMGGGLQALVDMVDMVKGNFSDTSLLGGFLNNHDNARFESVETDSALRMNAHAYALVTDGVPYVYYGSEAGFSGGNDPLNREPLWTSNYDTSSTMYKFFTNVNAARQAAGNASSTFYTGQMSLDLLTADHLLVAKPPLISLLTNVGSTNTSSTNLTIPSTASSWAANTQVIDAVSCETLTTDGSGDLSVGISKGLPRVLIQSSQKGSVCSNATSTATGSGSSSTGKSAAGRRAGVRGGAGVVLGGVAAAVMAML